ncbi:MAG: hypothetical protein ACREBG_21415 [Pyrinomonadaceae bacterium]
MGQKFSYRDPVTHRLKCWGYVERNDPGDIQQAEAADFNLDLLQRAWRWDGTQWVEILPFPVTKSDLLIALETAISATTLVNLREVLREWRKQVR